ncbi:MAG: DUF1802 family protein [Verrucomicrobia bacterium]|nr:DUF1802 family protein [Verrucomicrobiota bacterium]
MRTAFKEWAIVVDALGRGEQILILRKGGIKEARGSFHLEHERFLLFPTLFHQQRESVIPSAQRRYDEIAPSLPGKDVVRIEFVAHVEGWINLPSIVAAERLRGQHIWRDDVIADRFDWGREKSIYALAIRVLRLPQRLDLPMRESYAGCKSWVELEPDIDTTGATPVLDDAAFAAKLERFTTALELNPAG